MVKVALHFRLVTCTPSSARLGKAVVGLDMFTQFLLFLPSNNIPRNHLGPELARQSKIPPAMATSFKSADPPCSMNILTAKDQNV